MAQGNREEMLVAKLRKAYAVIADILVYSPEFMHSSPIEDYKNALAVAETWLTSEYGADKISAMTWADMFKESSEDELL